MFLLGDGDAADPAGEMSSTLTSTGWHHASSSLCPYAASPAAGQTHTGAAQLLHGWVWGEGRRERGVDNV